MSTLQQQQPRSGGSTRGTGLRRRRGERLFAAARAEVEASGARDLRVEDEHERGADRAERVGAGTLEHGRHALLLDDLGRAVKRALVQPLTLQGKGRGGAAGWATTAA